MKKQQNQYLDDREIINNIRATHTFRGQDCIIVKHIDDELKMVKLSSSSEPIEIHSDHLQPIVNRHTLSEQSRAVTGCSHQEWGKRFSLGG
jgi:hypothetical protein